MDLRNLLLEAVAAIRGSSGTDQPEDYVLAPNPLLLGTAATLRVYQPLDSTAKQTAELGAHAVLRRDRSPSYVGVDRRSVDYAVRSFANGGHGIRQQAKVGGFAAGSSAIGSGEMQCEPKVGTPVVDSPAYGMQWMRHAAMAGSSAVRDYA